MHESIQEPQSNDDSVTDDMLTLVLQKFKEEKGLCLENDGLCLGNDDENDKTNEMLYKKQNWRMAVQLMSRFFLHHKNLKEV